MTQNPMTAFLNLARTGGDPEKLLRQMALQDPRARQALGLIGGKTPQQLRGIVENMCRERGLTVEALASSLGLPPPGAQ